MGLGPIPWTAIWEYAQMEGCDDEDFRIMEIFILTLDRVFLEWNHEKQERESEMNKPAPSLH